MAKKESKRKVAFGSTAILPDGSTMSVGKGKPRTTMFNQSVEGIVSRAKKPGKYF